MTTQVIVQIPANQPDGVVVTPSSGTATPIGPGQTATFHVWKGQTLLIQERDGGGE